MSVIKIAYYNKEYVRKKVSLRKERLCSYITVSISAFTRTLTGAVSRRNSEKAKDKNAAQELIISGAARPQVSAAIPLNIGFKAAKEFPNTNYQSYSSTSILDWN